ncbi:MAG: FAD-linked oxidase [Gemmatimonadaceae bacterium]|nr:FAD-linked oxidase [Gemmatimonadaceae bacterium]
MNVLAPLCSAKRATRPCSGYGTGLSTEGESTSKPRDAMNQIVSGWGRHPRLSAEIDQPRDLEGVRACLRDTRKALIPRGLGRSYGDAALAARILSGPSLGHLLSFDAQTGRLRAQGGTTLDKVIDFALPRGWFLPVTPGTKFPTLAGCVAADVHGKNHHGVGSLSAFVETLQIVLADGSLVTCSREDHAELFWATMGGMGLTGVIYAVDLRLQPVHSVFVKNVSLRTGSLSETCRVLCETQDDYPYSVAWIDTLTRRGRGRGQVMLGAHAEDGRLQPLHRPPRLSVPDLPMNLVVRPGLHLVNRAKHGMQWRRRVAATVHYDPYFYPLDAIDGWNRLYGRRGFLQFQFAVPGVDGEAVMAAALERTNRAAPCALAVLKTFGDHPSGPLGFPLPGYTLALDFPRTDAIEEAVRAATDDIIAAGGRVYLAKDSVITQDQFAAMYPRLEEFRRLRRQVDPQGRFRSLQSDRLGLS